MVESKVMIFLRNKQNSKVLSKDDTRKLCLWKQLSKKRVFERFGREQETYDLVGRVHLDS